VFYGENMAAKVAFCLVVTLTFDFKSISSTLLLSKSKIKTL